MTTPTITMLCAGCGAEIESNPDNDSLCADCLEQVRHQGVRWGEEEKEKEDRP